MILDIITKSTAKEKKLLTKNNIVDILLKSFPNKRQKLLFEN